MLRPIVAVFSLLVLSLFTLVAQQACSEEDAAPTDQSPAAQATEDTSGATPAPPDETDAPEETPVPEEPQEAGFGDGTYVVGQEIQPGTYRTDSGDLCYFARLSGFGGSIDEIIANDNGSGPQIVTIASTDAGFETARCGDWVLDSGQVRADPNAPFGEGIYVVGRDVSPGTWRTEAGDRCYLARLSGFGRTIDDIITNDNPRGSVIVTIDASDAGFEASGCGQWTKVQ